MIIIREHQFAFVHIPKCAGISVRRQLQPLDDCAEDFRGVHDHPELGTIDRGHLPLSVVRQHFPQESELLRTFNTFAVLRNPVARFPSSLSQHLMMYGDKPVPEYSASELNARIETIIGTLESHPSEFLPLELTHFHKQIQYVFDEGQQVVNHVHRIDDMAAFWRDVETVLPDFSSEVQQTNETLFVKESLTGGLVKKLSPRIGMRLRSVIPRRAIDWAKRKMYVTRDERWSDVMNSQDIQKFVASYYKEDFDLYESVVGEREPS